MIFLAKNSVSFSFALTSNNILYKYKIVLTMKAAKNPDTFLLVFHLTIPKEHSISASYSVPIEPTPVICCKIKVTV